MYYSIVKNELTNFIGKYQENPFEFLTEYDLQSYLYFMIFDKFEKNKIKVKIETTEDDKSVKIFNPSRVIDINPTRREYSAFDGFDIAIIDDENLETIKSAYWHQLLKIAIEIKYHRSSMGNSVNKLIKGFEKDIDKLTKYKERVEKRVEKSNFYGIAILFIQNISDEKEMDLEIKFQNEYIKIKNLENGLFQKKITGFIVTKKYIYLKNS